MKVTQAIILAAGEGRRLRPITDVTPKPLVPFYGRPLIDWAIAKVVEAGVTRIAINAYHLADVLTAHLRSRYPHTLPDYPALHIATEPTLLGTGGAVRNLREWLKPEPFYVLNSDAVFAAPLTALSRSPSLLVTREPTYAADRRIVADATNPTDPGRWVALRDSERAFTFTGLTLADPDLPARLPDGPSCILRQGFVPYLDALDVRLVETTDFFADTGTPQALVDAHIRGEQYAREAITSRGTSPGPP